jgi:hypothetical protein
LWKGGDFVKRNVEGALSLSADSRVRMTHGSGDLGTQRAKETKDISTSGMTTGMPKKRASNLKEWSDDVTKDRDMHY